jgi:hypothetical protein
MILMLIYTSFSYLNFRIFFFHFAQRTVQWSELLPCFWEVSHSNLSWDIGYPD